MALVRERNIPTSSGVQVLTVSTATGTNHILVSATYSQRGLQATLEVAETRLWFVPVAVDTVKTCTPDDVGIVRSRAKATEFFLLMMGV